VTSNEFLVFLFCTVIVMVIALTADSRGDWAYAFMCAGFLGGYIAGRAR